MDGEGMGDGVERLEGQQAYDSKGARGDARAPQENGARRPRSPESMGQQAYDSKSPDSGFGLGFAPDGSDLIREIVEEIVESVRSRICVGVDEGEIEAWTRRIRRAARRVYGFGGLPTRRVRFAGGRHRRTAWTAVDGAKCYVCEAWKGGFRLSVTDGEPCGGAPATVLECRVSRGGWDRVEAVAFWAAWAYVREARKKMSKHRAAKKRKAEERARGDARDDARAPQEGDARAPQEGDARAPQEEDARAFQEENGGEE